MPEDPPAPPSPHPTRAALAAWFLQPPRRHGEQRDHRTVSYLELFYDLVFVVFVSQISGTLAAHVTWRAALDYVALFGVLWLLWFNGSSYHEIHGREDGRSRGLIFLQMGILALLAVYAANATGGDGGAFGWALVALLVVQSYQWWSVHGIDDPVYLPVARRYLATMLVAIVLAVASALVASDDLRAVLWGVLCVFQLGGFGMLMLRTPRDQSGFHITESMSERFALFTIIVLGEVVVGVVHGLSEAGRDVGTIATGLLSLGIGFGFWWTYFDLVGQRLPRDTPRAVVAWMFGHLPVAIAIAASGAGMVGLVEHATDGRTPGPQAWLIAGSVAAVLLWMVCLMQTLEDHHRLAHLHRPLTPAMLAAAAAVLAVGALRPTPWLLALVILLILSAVWTLGFIRVAAAGGLPGD